MIAVGTDFVGAVSGLLLSSLVPPAVLEPFSPAVALTIEDPLGKLGSFEKSITSPSSVPPVPADPAVIFFWLALNAR